MTFVLVGIIRLRNLKVVTIILPCYFCSKEQIKKLKDPTFEFFWLLHLVILIYIHNFGGSKNFSFKEQPVSVHIYSRNKKIYMLQNIMKLIY